MAVSGKVYIVPNPEERTWKLVVHNTGDKPFGLTQNILPANNPDMKAHDDHHLNGHGLGVNPGQVSFQKFHAGDQYTHQGNGISHVIGEESHLRVGLRKLAFKTIQLPPLNGPPVELDLADFNWYGGNAASSTPVYRDWKGSREHVSNAANGNAVLAQVQALMAASKHGVDPQGEAEIRAVRGDDGQLSHWEMWFHNQGDDAFIGTCVFKRGSKNEGIGLESMGLPNNGSSAMQRIEYLGNYGVEAVPGETLRVGVRGFSWAEMKLPADGSVKLPLTKFRLDTSKISDAFFDRDSIERKRNEKKDRVQFFEGGEAINDALEPPVLWGAQAIAECDFTPPNLEVRATEEGWHVKLESTMPEFDEHGRVGFVAGLLAEGANAQSAEARQFGGVKKFQYPGHTKEWFIPRGADLGGVEAKEGLELRLATRGTGWFANIRLPANGETIDSTKDEELWGLREDQIARRNLEPKFINRFRD